MIKSFMGFVDEILFEFKGQLSLTDIYSMTYKELGYLRQHRNKIREELNKSPGTAQMAAIEQMTSI